MTNYEILDGPSLSKCRRRSKSTVLLYRKNRGSVTNADAVANLQRKRLVAIVAQQVRHSCPTVRCGPSCFLRFSAPLLRPLKFSQICRRSGLEALNSVRRECRVPRVLFTPAQLRNLSGKLAIPGEDEIVAEACSVQFSFTSFTYMPMQSGQLMFLAIPTSVPLARSV